MTPNTCNLSKPSNDVDDTKSKRDSIIIQKAGREIAEMRLTANVIKNSRSTLTKIMKKSCPGVELTTFRALCEAKSKELLKINKSIRNIEQIIASKTSEPPEQILPPQPEAQSFDEVLNQILADIKESIQKYEDGLNKYTESLTLQFEQIYARKVRERKNLCDFNSTTPATRLSTCKPNRGHITTSVIPNVTINKGTPSHQPQSMNQNDRQVKDKRDNRKMFCHFHRAYGHNTKDCRAASDRTFQSKKRRCT